MAYPTEITLETGGVVREGGADQQVQVRVTWALERGDSLPTLADELAADLERAHAAVWRRVQGGEPEPVSERPRLVKTDSPRTESEAECEEVVTCQLDDEEVKAVSPPATAPQVIALRSHAYRAGKSRAELDALAADRFARDSVELLTKIEAAAFLLSLQRDGW
ncbi:hypothetical protein CCAX7_35220 [Capsulimonas corticalis]|uniref:Uncharacterized protein n=1 Tax=Capsulimonas corticalis TaxID=2219043 RepID=A0A402CY14_9BACT|nr:hypothetical protein [Capsulimonas corticalis]BDI31471.1 hypothetical protein CCAX7_35220 [Capsulimonas corticalis]